MTTNLTGKVALITGASAGIGASLRPCLGRRGRATGAHGAARGAARRAQATSRKAGHAGHQRPRRCPRGKHGEEDGESRNASLGQIDILINNTGVGNYKNLVDTSAKECDDMMDTNVRSTFLFTRHTFPVMLEQKQGTILMISSMAGVYGFGGEAVYCATKFAQVGFAQALDRELRPHGIKVGVICPGGVKTEFALGRGRTQEGVNNSDMLEPEDVAGAVLLACKQSSGSRIIEIQMRTMAESLA